MKIIKLTAENIKRLKAVEISPDGALQVITGRNAQGKTSVLDAIWLALGGGAASRETSRPVRDGEESASVELDLGDLVVTRTWKGGKTSLTVTSADGAKHSSPQTVLDSLVGRLSFDPLEFTRLSSREQREALLDLVDLGIDLAQLDADRQKLYDDRHAVGLQGKAIGEIPKVVADVPDAEVSATELIARLTHRNIRAAAQADEIAEVESIEREIAAAEQRLAELQQELVPAVAKVGQHEPLEEAADLTDQLSKVEETNRLVRANAEARAKSERHAALTTQYNGITSEIDALDEKKAKALAKAKFPVDGLGFDDTGVIYNGVPFSQASSAEQIRVSLAMAMSLNPELRVIRILDGSLLDDDNLALISEMASAHDYQVWIERVADNAGIGVVIEDGEVVA